jgi:hypothetical protein
MATFFVEQFGAGQGVILGIQARLEGVFATQLSIIDIHLDQTNLTPKRTGYVTLSVNGREFTWNFSLTDEAYDQRTIQGYAKKRNPDAVTN